MLNEPIEWDVLGETWVEVLESERKFSIKHLKAKTLCKCGNIAISSKSRRCHACQAAYSRQRYRANPESSKRYPERRKARACAARATVSGRLKRQPCQICGSIEDLERHHDDYSKPLEVRWLCRSCHLRHHHGDRLVAYD